MHPLIQKLLTIAQSQVGVREEGGNNRGPQIVIYQQATWLAPGAWPWCAAFCCWVLREWLKDAEVMGYFSLKPLNINTWRCRGANTTDWKKWAKDKGHLVLDNTFKPEPGDIVIFDFTQDGKTDHIGIVCEGPVAAGGNFKSIEGNTNAAGGADSLNGDGVTLKVRSPKQVNCYLRMIVG